MSEKTQKSRYTTIALSHETKERLNEIGRKGETYDDIVVRLLDFFEEARKNERDE
ncbi:MAG: DUF7557 family protein [Methermicoccaceae archaeon]